jgi:hypothetical protein
MTCLRQTFCFLAAATLAVTASAQNSSASFKFAVVSTNLLPPPPTTPPSPVNFFRQLLAMSPAERNNSLSNRPPEVRARLLAKVREYQALDTDERELRLRATELRWQLMPLFRAAPETRAARLAQVPDDLRELVKSRLNQWNLIPPLVQKELLANDDALHYFAHVETTNTAASEAQQKISAQFNQFFELTAGEKKQTLATLSQSERAQMETTLKSFEQLPAQQRQQCVKNYAKFAGMGVAERAEFLESAERWSQMSPQERQTWRDLVAHVPQWPPLPPAVVPQNLIPRPPKISRPSVATN